MPMALAAAVIEPDASMRSSSSRWSQRRPRAVGNGGRLAETALIGVFMRSSMRYVVKRHNDSRKKAAWRSCVAPSAFSATLHSTPRIFATAVTQQGGQLVEATKKRPERRLFAGVLAERVGFERPTN